MPTDTATKSKSYTTSRATTASAAETKPITTSLGIDTARKFKSRSFQTITISYANRETRRSTSAQTIIITPLFTSKRIRVGTITETIPTPIATARTESTLLTPRKRIATPASSTSISTFELNVSAITTGEIYKTATSGNHAVKISSGNIITSADPNLEQQPVTSIYLQRSLSTPHTINVIKTKWTKTPTDILHTARQEISVLLIQRI